MAACHAIESQVSSIEYEGSSIIPSHDTVESFQVCHMRRPSSERLAVLIDICVTVKSSGAFISLCPFLSAYLSRRFFATEINDTLSSEMTKISSLSHYV